MQIIQKPIHEIVEYENNPRHNDKAVDYVARSIERFGFMQPVVVDKNGVIAVGHTRVKAAIKLGYDSVPCVIAEELSDDEIKAYRLADNKTGEHALWDDAKLMAELSSINFDMNCFGEWQAPDVPDYCPSDIPDVPKELHYCEKFGVVIDCENEGQQRNAFEFVTGAGYQARIVSI